MLIKNLQLLFLGVGLALAILFFTYEHHNGQWLIPTDTYYYIALADSLLQNKELLDLTTIPPNPLVTYQNGVPFVYAILKGAGLDNLAAMKVFSLFNLFCWISACYPFFKLIELFGITSSLARGFLLVGFFGSSSLLNFQFTPGTDGVFNSASIWLVYLLIFIFKDFFTVEKRDKSSINIMILSAFLISIITVHFSIRILFYQSAFLASILLCKVGNKRKMVLFSVLLIATTACALASPYFIFKPLMTEEISQPYQFLLISREEPIRIMLSQFLGVGRLLDFINGYLLLFIFLGFLFFSMIHARIKNEFAILFISLNILVFLSVNFLLTNSTMVQAGARYMISTMPLFCLLVVFFKYSRPIAYLMIATFSAVTILSLASPYPAYCVSTFWTNFYAQTTSLPDKTILLTDRGRYGYVFLNGRNYTLPLSSLDPSYEHIWLAGSVQFINEKLRTIKESENFIVEQVTVLKSDHLSGCQSALVQCDIKKSD